MVCILFSQFITNGMFFFLLWAFDKFNGNEFKLYTLWSDLKKYFKVFLLQLIYNVLSISKSPYLWGADFFDTNTLNMIGFKLSTTSSLHSWKCKKVLMSQYKSVPAYH